MDLGPYTQRVSLRTGNNNTMCLEYNDYEVIDCSEKTLKKPVENYYFICDGLDVISIKNKIEEVQKKITNY